MATPNRSGTRKPDPKRWTFSDEYREKYVDRFWKAPRRLVKVEGSEEPGLWAQLWREEGTTRGGGAVTSVLPVLALHTWPGKKNMDGADVGRDADPGWTGWTYIGRRRIAGLAGVNKDTASEAFRRLTAAGLMETKRVPRAKYEGGYKTFFRLSADLYAEDGDYAAIPANFFYGGSWFMLPTNAARHLYVVLACLDPITDEAAYLAKIEADHPGGLGAWESNQDFPGWWWEQYDYDSIQAFQKMMFLGERARRPLSLSELETYSGLTRGTLREALRVLTTPVFGNSPSGSDKHYPPIAMIAKGNAEPRRPTWYAPDRRAVTWFWTSDFLNDPARVERSRREYWPQLERRRTQARKRAEVRATWMLDGAVVDTEAKTLAERIARLELSPWEEAQALAEIRERLEAAGRSVTGAALARLVNRNEAIVNHALRIAGNLTPYVLECAELPDIVLNRLARTALLEAARQRTSGERAEILRRAAREERFTSWQPKSVL